MDVEERGRQDATNLELVPSAYDTSEYLFDIFLLADLNVREEYEFWDRLTNEDEEEQPVAANLEVFDAFEQFTDNSSQMDSNNLEENCNSSMYGTCTEDTLSDINDDIHNLSVPISDFKRTMSGSRVDVVLEKFESQDAVLSNDAFVITGNTAGIDAWSSDPDILNNLGKSTTATDFDVQVMTGYRTSYVFRNRSLYARINTDVRFTVHCPIPPPPGSFIRICTVYSESIYANEPVRRCSNHRLKDSDHEDHFIVVDNSMAKYLTEKCGNDESSRSFIIVPFDALPKNQHLVLQFRCYSSCAGGIKRRAVVLCFSLENGNHLLAHSAMFLKVCSKPTQSALIGPSNGSRRSSRIRCSLSWKQARRF